MAIIKGTPVITTQGASSTFTINLPTYTAGHVWIAIIQTRAITTMTTPAGWTLHYQDRAATSSSGPWVYVFYRVPDGTEGTTLAIATGGTGSAMLSAVYPMSGVDTANTFDGSVGANDSSTVAGTEIINDGTTTLYANSFLFNIQSATLTNDDIIFTSPVGWTTDLDYNYTYNDLNVNYKLQASAGATGAVNGAMNVASRWVSVVFALKDAGEVAVNESPSISVGVDQYVAVGATVTLSAEATDPESQPLTYAWAKVSGPTGGTIASPSAATTQVSSLVAGTYIFQCTATDSQNASTSDTLQVVVSESTTYPTVYVLVGSTWERRRLYTRVGGNWV